MDMSEVRLALVPLLPLVGSAGAFSIGRLKRSSAGVVATAAAFSSFVLVLSLVMGLGSEQVIEARFWNWFSVGTFSVDLSLRLDRLSAVMCLIITGIGTLIHLYSMAYMAEDEGVHRFFCYLNLFLFAMLVLVLGSNLLVLFVGWEGVGLCSYLLIGFWFKNLAYCRAGRKAFVVNRIGDAGVLLAMFLLIGNYGSLDFKHLSDAIAATGTSYSQQMLLTAVGLALFVGACGKSAQLPLFVWLPDAMAGPTPVSALIHAATMVTAGIYLTGRMYFVFDAAPLVGGVITVIALITAFLSATIAVVQNDIKKVLAYSTVSQLGFMFLAVGAGAYWVALFHVITHAFFKACLFLGAGSVIHGCHHEQDMRHMGGLKKLMPVTFTTYAISTLAIAGIYPFAGYQSKHAIFAALADTQNPIVHVMSPLVLLVASITAGLTAFYMTRSVALTFFGEYRGHAHPHESPWQMTLPLVVLAALAVGGGIWLEHALPEYLHAVLPRAHAHESASIVASLLSSWIGFAGVGLGLLLYVNMTAVPKAIGAAVPNLMKVLSGKYFIDEIYNVLIVRPLEVFSQVLFKGVDQGIIDGAVNGVGDVVEVGGEIARSMQTGEVRHYALFIFAATTGLVAIYLVLS
jgi:NADH-quinone oxidoreductase subunit L